MINTSQIQTTIQATTPNVNQQPESPGICARMASTTSNGMRRFGAGIAAAGVISPLSFGLVSVATRSGLIPDHEMGIVCRVKSLFTDPKFIPFVCVVAPIAEEILFRGAVQDVLLTRIPKLIVRKIQPGKEAMFDTKKAMAARILLTSALFSYAHSGNAGMFPDAYVKAQLVYAAAMGIGLGVLKESKYGLSGSIGAHVASSVAGIIELICKC